MNKAERADRQRRAAARRAAQVAEAQTKPGSFRVLLVIHRPRYRSRAERAVTLPGWEIRSLLNREDPIGIINRQQPDIFIVSVDKVRHAGLGYLRAAQRWRGESMRVIGLFESAEEAQEHRDECDTTLTSPWKAVELRSIVAGYFKALRGELPDGLADMTDED